jgi:hypothetical protein
LYRASIAPMQRRIELAFRSICEALSRTHLRAEELVDLVLARHSDLVHSPSKCELSLFRSLFHLENFGRLGVSRFNAESKLSLPRRLWTALELIRNPNHALLRDSWWPPLTLDNLGLGSMIGWYANDRKSRRERQ